ncbi:MAG: hypothetical protein IPQ28_12210 [Sphingobacteriales bacterium]|nr:hypothetical protein [Sphingobacteriales bacterium]
MDLPLVLSARVSNTESRADDRFRFCPRLFKNNYIFLLDLFLFKSCFKFDVSALLTAPVLLVLLLPLPKKASKTC